MNTFAPLALIFFGLAVVIFSAAEHFNGGVVMVGVGLSLLPILSSQRKDD